MGQREAYKAFNDILNKCNDGWTVQFNKDANGMVKVTAFKNEKDGLSFDIDIDNSTIEQFAWMTRKLIFEVEAIGTTEETTGKNRTIYS